MAAALEQGNLGQQEEAHDVNQAVLDFVRRL